MRCLDNAIADAVSSFSTERDAGMAVKQSTESNQRLGFLVHELRNSIGTATLAASALETGNLPISGATGSVLKRSIAAMTTLIDRALAEVRSKNAIAVPGETFSVAALIADARDGATLDASATGCALVTPEVDSSLWGICFRTPSKFTRSHTEVTSHAHAAGDRVLIDVKDNCGGLSAGALQKMFTPFSQRRGDRIGLGMGLSIAKESIEADAGVLTVRDVPGTGCIFTISLPLHPLQLQ